MKIIHPDYEIVYMKFLVNLILISTLFACSITSEKRAHEAPERTPQSSLTGICSPYQSKEQDQKFEHYHYGGYTFTVRKLSAQGGIVLSPQSTFVPYLKQNSRNQVVRDLDSIWNNNGFSTRAPLRVGPVSNSDVFVQRMDLRILDMPIKMSGSNEYRIPRELAPFREVIQQIIDHEHKMLSPEVIRKYYAYITIDQGLVEAGKTQRKPGAHVDGFQGARINPKNEINHSYLVSNLTPTAFYRQGFDFSQLNEKFHDYFFEMDSQASSESIMLTRPLEIYLMDAYSVHSAVEAQQSGYRTFLRISYDVKEFDRLGNTHNPMFDYNWVMKPRDVQSGLVRFTDIGGKLKRLISGAARGRRKDFLKLQQNLQELRTTNDILFYNLSYKILEAGEVNLAHLVFEEIKKIDPSDLRAVRLLFSFSTDSSIQGLIRIFLNNQLQRARGSIDAENYNNLITEINTVDLITEINTVDPTILPKEEL